MIRLTLILCVLLGGCATQGNIRPPYTFMDLGEFGWEIDTKEVKHRYIEDGYNYTANDILSAMIHQELKINEIIEHINNDKK